MKARINDIECILFYEERIPTEKAPIGYPYAYHIRHDENDWTCPISIERFVAVNFFGTIFVKKPIELSVDSTMEIKQFKLEDNYVKFRLNQELLTKILDCNKVI